MLPPYSKLHRLSTFAQLGLDFGGRFYLYSPLYIIPTSQTTMPPLGTVRMRTDMDAHKRLSGIRKIISRVSVMHSPSPYTVDTPHRQLNARLSATLRGKEKENSKDY
jgi:hypothetical protein